MSLTKYLSLPSEITAFERRFLLHLNKIALAFFYLHIPVLMAVAWSAGTGPMLALVKLGCTYRPDYCLQEIIESSLRIGGLWSHGDADGRSSGPLRTRTCANRDALLLLRSARHALYVCQPGCQFGCGCHGCPSSLACLVVLTEQCVQLQRSMVGCSWFMLHLWFSKLWPPATFHASSLTT